MKQLHLLVSGKVQGVGFRYFAQMKAVQYGVTGWVKNHTNGAVEIMVCGEDWILEQYIKDIKEGNPFSTVESVDITEKDGVEQFKSFKIKY